VVSESAPASFDINKGDGKDFQGYDNEETKGNTKVITWNISIKKGEKITLGYMYQPPPISPEFYLLGPAQFLENNKVIFQEARQWEVANDTTYACAPVATGTGGSKDWNTAANWTNCNGGYPGQKDPGSTDIYNVTISETVAVTWTLSSSPQYPIGSLSITSNSVGHTVALAGFNLSTTKANSATGAVTINYPSSSTNTNQITTTSGTLDAAGLISQVGCTTNKICLLTTATGTITARAGVTMVSSSYSQLTVTSTGTFNLAGTFAAASSATVTLAAGSTTHIIGAATVNKTLTFGNLTLDSGSSLALGIAQTVAGTGGSLGASNWMNNSGSATPLSGNFGVSFSGAAPAIGGSSSTNFYGVTIGAITAAKLYQNMSVGAGNLVFTADTGANQIQLDQNGYNLTDTGAVTFNQPGATYVSTWAVGAGTADISGTLTFSGTNTTTGRAAKITVATGGNLNLKNTGAASLAFAANSTLTDQVIDLSAGSGTVNISGTITNSANAESIPGTTSTWNFNGTVAQTVPMGTAGGTYWGNCNAGSTQCYANLTIMNTNAGGATLGNTQASGNVVNNVTVGDGSTSNVLYQNGGYNITNNSTGIFTVNNLATFNMTGGSAYPAGFSTYTYGATSTVAYLQNAGPVTVKGAAYGNLTLTPSTNASVAMNFEAAAFTAAGTLTTGVASGATLAAISANSATSLDVVNVSIGANSTFTAPAAGATFTVSGNWANAGAFTHNSGTVTLDGSSQQTLSGTLTDASAFNNLTITNASGVDATDSELTNFTPGIIFAAAATSAGTYTITTPSVRVQYISGATYTFNNINWNGQATGTRIFFRNSVAGSGTWLLKVTGTQTAASYINVSRSDASVAGGNVIVSNSTNVSIGDTNWNIPPLNVYYSVGQSTANLMTGTPTMTMTGGAATFSAAQTGNIGVGDQVTTFPSTGILDNFDRADGYLGSNWTLPPVGGYTYPSISSNQVISSGLGDTSFEYWNAQTFTDSEAYVDIPTLPTSGLVGVVWRLADGNNWYDAQYNPASGGSVQVYKDVGGVETQIGANISGAFSPGDSLGASMVGSNIYVFRKTGGVWSQIGAFTDTALTSGYIGTFIDHDATAVLDNFGGGAVTSAYISGKTSQTQWSLVTAAGQTPADVSGLPVVSITHVFTTLQGAVAGASGANFINNTDLTAANVVLNIPCYYDSAADTSPVTVSGYTTDASHYIKIYTPSSTTAEANNSQRAMGKWDDGKYNLKDTADYTTLITVNQLYTVIDGLQFDGNNTGHGIGILVNVSNAAATIRNNLLRNIIGTSPNSGASIFIQNGNSTKIYNNIVIGSSQGVNGIRVDQFSVAYVYNNTVYGSGISIGINCWGSGGSVLKNNLVQGSVVDYSGTFDASSANNISQDATSPNSTLRNQTVKFQDAANNDYHLAPNDTAAKGYGTNLSADPLYPFTTDIDGQTRSRWDIGADESATAIYYSVGQNTSDHKTGAPTITLSGYAATLSVGQTAPNMGVGDLITYTGGSCFISGKTNADGMHWNCQNATGGTAPQVSTVSVTSIAHAFDSLKTAVSYYGGTHVGDASHLNTYDLYTNNYQLNIPCYYDTGTENTDGSINIAGGWKQALPNFLRIYTPTNTATEVNVTQRHSGKWDAGKYSLTLAAGSGRIAITDSDSNFLKIDGLQIYLSGPTGGDMRGISVNYPSDRGNRIEISNNIITGSVQDYVTGINIRGYYGQAINAYVYNNLIYDLHATGVGSSAGISGGLAAHIYNNTVINSDTGIYAEGTTAIVKNNLTQSCANAGYAGSFDASSSNNISGDNTSPNSGSTDCGGHSCRSQTVTFKNASAKDFHLARTDTVAKDAGADLSADSNFAFNTDIDGQARPYGSAWDIGADEITNLDPGTPGAVNVGHNVNFGRNVNIK